MCVNQVTNDEWQGNNKWDTKIGAALWIPK